jgi:hypothetical protein
MFDEQNRGAPRLETPHETPSRSIHIAVSLNTRLRRRRPKWKRIDY